MMFGYIGSDGTAFPPIWIKGNLDSTMYKRILSHTVFPMLDRTYGVGKYIWVQDGASAHTANSVLAYLKRKLGSNGFWSKGIWPANSCNLNPLDFSVWDYVATRACNVHHSNVNELKSAVEREWAALPRSYVVKTCRRFRPRVEAMVRAGGGVFEKE